ncbi:hypothetical protein ACXR8F_02455 [Terrabacter sp. AAH1]
MTADPTAPARATAPAGATASSATTPETTRTTGPTTSASPTESAGVPNERTSYATVKAVIKDPDLGHTITAVRVARHLSWPTGQPIGAAQFEIVGVRLSATAGSRYSATIDPQMFTLVTSSPKQTVTPTNEFASRWRATPLKAAQRAATTSGWVFFKVDRGTTSALKLGFNRPAYQVSTTGKKLPAKTFTAVLTK